MKKYIKELPYIILISLLLVQSVVLINVIREKEIVNSNMDILRDKYIELEEGIQYDKE